jgi:hypothetical protein
MTKSDLIWSSNCNMRLLRNAIVLLLLTTVMDAQDATQEPFNFSRMLATLSFVERNDYPESELGYSLRYQNDKLLKADIYVYDKGLKGLKDGISSQEIKAEMKSVFEGIQMMVEKGYYEDVEELKQGERISHPHGIKFLWTRYRLRQIEGAEIVYTGKRISDTFLLVKNGKFVKIRITTKESDLAEHEKEIGRFVDQVAAYLQ